MRRIGRILALLISLSVFGCAPFKSKYLVDKNFKLNKDNLYLLDGRYEVVPSKVLYKSQSDTIRNDTSLYKSNLLGSLKEIDTVLRNDILHDKTSFSIIFKVKSQNNISVFLNKNQKTVDSANLIFKLKKDGYLYFTEKTIETWGVPGLYGRVEISRQRLGINENHDLLMESSYYMYGAALIVIGDDRKFKASSLYKRMN